MNRKNTKACQAEAAHLDCIIDRIVSGKGHDKIYLTHTPTGHRFVVTPSGSNDSKRQVKFLAQDIKKELMRAKAG